MTAPTMVCVVEMGSPVPEAMTTVVAVASCAAKPLDGVRCVMLVPMVFITWYPRVARPMTMPTAPSERSQALSSAPSSPLLTISATAARGPTAFATSFEPWAKAMAQAVMMRRMVKTLSTFS